MNKIGHRLQDDHFKDLGYPLNYVRVRMPVLLVVLRVTSKLGTFSVFVLSTALLRENSLRQGCTTQISEWGSTKTTIFLDSIEKSNECGNQPPVNHGIKMIPYS